MKKFIKANLLTLVGTIAGAVTGYLYWKFVGCSTGTCIIQSNPYRMTLFGAIFGGLILNMFQSSSKQQKHEQQ